jgi:diguanylate cyclase (GGDEF)-like protein
MNETKNTYHLTALFDSFLEGLLVTDPDDRIVLSNPIVSNLLGVPVDRLMGQNTREIARESPHLAWVFDDEYAQYLPCWEIMQCEQKDCELWGQSETDCWTKKSCSVCSNEKSSDNKDPDSPFQCFRCRVYKYRNFQREKEFQRTPQDRIILQVTYSRILSSSRRYLGKARIIRDVTQERELNQMKDDFLSVLSHELRNPLTSIRSYSEILLNYPDTDIKTQKEFLEIIAAESEKLDQTIEDIMELQRLESTRSTWNNEKISLEAVLKKAILNHKNVVANKNLTCSVTIHPDCPPLWADFDKILQVVNTLFRAIEKGAPPNTTISLNAQPIEGRREADVNTIVKISISNMLEVEQKGRLQDHDKVHQYPLERKKRQGLSLVLCKKILDQYGGNLWTENGASGDPRSFHFTMPSFVPGHGHYLEEEQEEKKTSDMEMVERKSPEIQKTKKVILIVDDDPSIVNAMVFALSKEGYHVHSSTSARRASDMVKEVRPDLIISDIAMPEMNGYEFFNHLQSDESTRMIPFIFVSAKGEITDRIQGFKTGVDDYLCKPFEIRELLARIERLLGRVEMYKDLSRFDGLTGALTRRTFEETLEKEIQKALLSGRPLSLAMADLDSFKNVNDSYGHLIGDFVLSSFVDFLRKNLREEDVLARYGGEEFFIIMPEVHKLTAVEILERIRNLLNETTFPYETEGRHITITSSFGLSGFPEDGANAEVLVKKADEALYLAKSMGRNRVVPYTDRFISDTRVKQKSQRI